ncbi:hypothetical protein yc1106_00031 [Curvularia clavata]|uniref:Xylanolytic transcriptional activator regulatory domain-containing protein n=1 Tax=Curvularia clavata TaxID=95742 RepID=A0A9Q9DN31_CURCL|nr:hypothetical protein yc1106_00031 [Curvularia clavata]
MPTLAREVQAIKETVESSNRQTALQTPPSSVTALETQPAFSTAASEHNSRHGDNSVIVDDAQVDSTVVPSLPRALNSLPFTGPEIDEHFNMYFRHCHPHFPILSEHDHDPNKCYDTSPFLFWVIMLISCRRQPTHSNPAMVRLLTEHVKHETDAAVLKVPQPLTQLQAILLVAAWGLYPGIRFINDPAYWLSGIAINSCLLLGFHTGSGRHQSYNHVTLAASSSDREAAVTWVASNVLNRRLSTNLGVPCTAPMNKTTINMINDESSILPTRFRVQLECQIFMDRVNKTLGSSLEESNGVPYDMVRMFEDEWAAAQARIIAKHTDPVVALYALFVLLEVQVYYFLPIPTQNSQSSAVTSPPSVPENLSPSIETAILRCYTTASTIITRAVDLDETTNLLHYLPHYIIRPIANAICVIFRIIRSDLPLRHPHIVVAEEAAKLSVQAVTVSRRVSTVEGDLAWRLARCVELWHTTSAPYLTAAAAAAAANHSNAGTGYHNENGNTHNEAGSAGAGLDYEPVLVDTFRQRMVAALGFDFMIRWKTKYGPVHMGPYGPHPQGQNLGLQVGASEAVGHTGRQQQMPSESSTGTNGPVNNRCRSMATSPDNGPTRFQGIQQDRQRLQSQQHPQQPGMQADFNSTMMPPGEAGLSLPSAGTIDTDPLLGTDWGFLDDFGWGFDMQVP